MRRIVLFVSIVLLALNTRCAMSSVGDYYVDGDVSVAYLRSLADDRSQCIKRDLWIEGHVVLNDKLDECYKSIVVEDSTAGIEIKVDVEDVDYRIPLFSEVRVRCSGLYIGREGERVVLGVAPTDVYVVDRIPEEELQNYIKPKSLDGVMPPQYQHATVGEVNEGLMQRYVRIEGLRLIGSERGATWGDSGNDISKYDMSLRHFTDGCDTLVVATLNKCHYAKEVIPSDIVTLIGVVDSFDHQHVLRLSDRQILY